MRVFSSSPFLLSRRLPICANTSNTAVNKLCTVCHAGKWTTFTVTSERRARVKGVVSMTEM